MPPVSRARRTIFTAADGLTSKRRAASRAELPASTARTRRRRRSWDRGAVITASPLKRERRIRSRDPEQPQTALAPADREDLRHDILLAMLLRAPRYDSARSRWSTFNALLARHAVADRIRTSRIGMRPAMVVLEPETHAGCASATSPLPGDGLGEVTLRLDLLSVAAELPARLHETLRLLTRHDDAGAAWRSSRRSRASFHRDMTDLRAWLHAAGLLPGRAPGRVRSGAQAPEARR